MQTARNRQEEELLDFAENKSPNERSELKRLIRGGGRRQAGREKPGMDCGGKRDNWSLAELREAWEAVPCKKAMAHLFCNNVGGETTSRPGMHRDGRLQS